MDEYLNLKLTNMTVVDPQKHPQLVAVSSCFIRGSVIRYIHLPAADCNLSLLNDSTRRTARGQ